MTPAKAHAKPGKEVVYLDVDDDITTIVDKVEAAKDKIVALVLPKRFATLQSIVNMRLLKRSADTASKNIVLITSEAALLPLAGAAEIHVAKNLQSKPEIPPSPVELPQDKPLIPDDPDAEVDAKDAKLDYHRSIGELAATGAVDEPETIPLDDADEDSAEPKPVAKSPKDKRLKVPDFDRFRMLLFGGILALVLLIVFIIMAIAVWPKATITLQTEATPLSTSFELTASDKVKALDEDRHLIPATLKTSDLTSSQQAQATGQQNNGQKATGSVNISNCTNGAVTIPAGTGVSTGGLVFITQSTLSLDSGNFTSGGVCKSSGSHVGSTNVTAQQGGSKYNIASGQTFGVSGQASGISGSNSSAFNGGTDNIVTVLSQSDVDAVKNKITDQDKNNFTDTFKKDLADDGYYVLTSTLKANDPAVNATPAVGQPASTANVSIKITYTVLVVQKNDLKKILTDELNKQLDKSKQKIGTDDVVKNASVDVKNQSSPNVANLSVSEDTTAIPIIDTALVKKHVEGLKAGDIKSTLSNWPGVKNVEVKMSPFWVSKAPKKPNKIVVIFQQVKTNSP